MSEYYRYKRRCIHVHCHYRQTQSVWLKNLHLFLWDPRYLHKFFALYTYPKVLFYVYFDEGNNIFFMLS